VSGNWLEHHFMPRTNFSPKLARLLFIRGVCRAILPLAVLWGIYDWYRIGPLYAIIFFALTGNYLLMYAFSWVAPHLLGGPGRVRPWQTFVLLGNAILLPFVFHGSFGNWPWLFIAVQVLMVAALYVSTAILFYFNDRLPMSTIFQTRRGGLIPSAPPPPTTPDNAS
jgi:hypothetical protein